MKKVIAILVCVLCFSVSVEAREIAGVDVAEEITQADGTVLRLNGAGIRSKFFFKIYVGALYLETISSDSSAVINDGGGKRIVLHFLYDEVEKEDLVEAWNDGFEGNGSEAQLAGLAQQITAFNGMFNTVKAGDVVTLDYVPESGTSVMIKNENKGLVEGKPFNDLLLSIWLGKEPVTEDLRDELLGK